MARRANPAVLVVALTVSVVGPPGYADNPDFAGLSCGFAAHGDPTLTVERDPNIRRGVLFGGPVVAADVVDDSSPGGTHFQQVQIELRCWLQYDDATNDAAHAFAAGNDQPYRRVLQTQGNTVAVGVTDVRYKVPSDQSIVYVCSWVRYMHADEVTDVYRDADPMRVGNQCDQAVSATGNGLSGNAVVPAITRRT